jgi:predicted DNA-binding transcriptional regulator AlpA
MQRPIKVDPKQAEIEMSRAAQASPLGDDAIVPSERVALILGCSGREVSVLRKDGRLPPAVRIGRLLRWRLADIRQWVRSGCKG